MRVPSVDDETSRKFRVFVHTCVKAAVTAVSSVMQQVLESAQAAFVERAAGIKELYRRDLQRVRAIAAQRGPALPLTNMGDTLCRRRGATVVDLANKALRRFNDHAINDQRSC